MDLLFYGGLACAGLWGALALAAAVAGGHRWAPALVAVVRWSAVAFVASSLGLMVWLYRREHDWVHLLWTSTTPQLVLFVGAGAFLLRSATGPDCWPWVLLVGLLLLALLPGVLIQLDPPARAYHRNVGVRSPERSRSPPTAWAPRCPEP